MAVDFNDGRINHGVFHVRVIRDGVEYPFENISFDPMAKSFEHGVPMTEILRQIAPWTPGSHNPQNRLHEQTGVSTCPARVTAFAKTMRFNLLPLSVRQAKPIHEKLLLGA
jgi:hypothetical protein